MLNELPIKPDLKDFGINESELDTLEKEKNKIDKFENILSKSFFVLNSIFLTVLFAILITTKSNDLPDFFQSIIGIIILCILAFFSSFLFQIIVFPLAFLNVFLSGILLKLIFGKPYLKKIQEFKWDYINYNNSLREYKEGLETYWLYHPDSKRFGENLKAYLDDKEQKRLKSEQEKNERLKIKHTWLDLSGYDFELEIANLYQKMGYKVKPTRFSGDGGIDLFLYDANNRKIILQCKNHRHAIGPAIARELFGVMISEKADKAILVCSGGFTKGVYSFVKGKNIELITIENIIQFHSKY